MELKHKGGDPDEFKTMSFNRTFMELKLDSMRRFRELFGCFNRTFMELKLARFCK